MIESVMIAVCDRCGKNYLQYNGETRIFCDIEYALMTCIYSGWAKIDGKLYCPKCHEYNVKTGEYKQKKQRGINIMHDVIRNRMLLKARSDLAKKVRDKLDEDIANIPKMTDRELLENIYRELIVFHRYKQITDLED